MVFAGARLGGFFFLFSLSPKSEADTLTFISSDAKRDWLGHFAEAPDCETWGNITDPAALCAPFAAARPSHMHTHTQGALHACILLAAFILAHTSKLKTSLSCPHQQQIQTTRQQECV
jgi:hypothetical protein